MYRSRKYNLNENFFETINTEQKAYVLGLIYSDGWMRDDGYVGIASTDEEIPTMIRDALKSDYNIKHRKPKVGRMLFELGFSSVKIRDDLYTLGCHPKKSHTISFPNIQDDMVHHFIRGLWDGDGCIRFTNSARADLCGSKDICESVRKIVNPIIGSSATVRPHSNIFRIAYSGSNSCFKLKEFLYNDATVYLKRKKDLFDSIVLKYRNRKINEN